MRTGSNVSVLFNESKLLKLQLWRATVAELGGFSTLQRVEIAEMFCGADRRSKY